MQPASDDLKIQQSFLPTHIKDPIFSICIFVFLFFVSLIVRIQINIQPGQRKGHVTAVSVLNF